MKKQALFAAALMACAAFQAHATEFEGIEDTDGNGMYSLEEIKASNPDFDEAQFKELDVDGSGELSDDELDAIQD